MRIVSTLFLIAQPIHWIYSNAVMTKVLAGVSNPEFISPSSNPYYSIPTGSQSPYGDLLLVMLESLVACKGGFTEYFIPGFSG